MLLFPLFKFFGLQLLNRVIKSDYAGASKAKSLCSKSIDN